MGPAGAGVNSLYRSVPPRPLSYTFSDVLQASLEPRTTAGSGKRARSKTAPLTANAAEEYAERFRARPTTRPSVIDFTGCGVKMYTGTGGCRRNRKHPGQFPAVKSRNVTCIPPRPRSPVPKTIPQPLTERGTAATSSLHLAPLAKGTEPNSALSLQTKPYRPPPLPVHSSTTPKPSKTSDHSKQQGAGRSATSSVKSRGKSSKSTCSQDREQGGSEKAKCVVTSQRGQPITGGGAGGAWVEELSTNKLSTVDAMAFAMSPQMGSDHLALPDVLAHSEDFDDLTDLPRPKRILPRRDLPWVFRFKVKKEMNALSKIMASKPNSGNSVTAATSIV